MNTAFIAALDVGGTKLAAVVAGPEGPLARVTQSTVKTGPARALPEQGLALIDAACAQAGIEPASVMAVGVASCGPFVYENGMIALSTPNLCGGRSGAEDLPNDWLTIPLEEVLRERFSTVAIENDCVAALVAELGFGAVIGETDCVYVTWSTGVGFGLCVDGRVLRGKNGNAGHAGHILMSDTWDAICGCGNRGDLESLVSGRNIGNRLKQPTADLFRAAREGTSSEAREIVLEAARWFGKGLYNVTATLDTRVFVIGGSVWQHHGAWLTPYVLQEIESRLPAVTTGVRIVPAALGKLVADIGALALVLPPEWQEEWQRTQPWKSLAS